MSASPEVVGDTLLCEGRRVRLYRREVRYGGKTYVRDVVAFGQGVVIVPVKSDGRIVFVEQWRAPLKRWVIELPAGKLEEGEKPLEAARRELEEETGYRAGKWEYVGGFSVAPGYSDEVLHFFIASGLEHVGARPELGEVIRVVEMGPGEYLESVAGGVGDLKTVAGVLLYISARGRGGSWV
ncbi:NUDIX hydrolase [Infirmifilum lucidum]|uniref:NUDIX hydrolase n=1 Tax=Infirmifilum lucidum TaxID=2776706 RepID=A0A7L9FIB0_9CREN|nr:NUDIX hydrolase [Infirmifilum lucidum]QOJ79102.1 NUDIX hydrolase [Infirmifilum lucidum]